MTKCIYCGKHLYKEINFYNLFKWDYVIHLECEMKVKQNDDYNTFPFMDKQVMIDYIFKENRPESNVEEIDKRYYHFLFERALNNPIWSVIIIADNKLTDIELIMVTKLADRNLLLLMSFDENFLRTE